MSICDPRDLVQIQSVYDSALNTRTLRLGDTVITEVALKELLVLREFMYYLADSNTEVGDHWVAFKTKKRILK